MNELEQWVEGLTAPDHRAACACMKRLQAESAASDAVYAYFDRFAAMLDSPNSYVRTRGLLLLAANARWDGAHRLDGILDRYLEHILDEKPITARQCIQSLPEIARRQPHLTPRIRAALESADPRRYPDSMEPLVRRDLFAALGKLPD